MNGQETIVVAGSTGYLGRYIVSEAVQHGYEVRALTRDASRTPMGDSDLVEPVVFQTTDLSAFDEACANADYVISSLGITRQKGFSYEEVDYGVNAALLRAAIRAGVRKFVYVSVLNPSSFAGNAMVEAKEKFCRLLEGSGLDYSIIRPTGYFSDIGAFITMAARGRIYIPGAGTIRLNPIHGEDLARVILDSLSGEKRAIEAGGPDVFTMNEIADVAFRTLGETSSITHLPYYPLKLLAGAAGLFDRKLATIGDFMLRGTRVDMVAPAYGRHTLAAYFQTVAEEIRDGGRKR